MTPWEKTTLRLRGICSQHGTTYAELKSGKVRGTNIHAAMFECATFLRNEKKWTHRQIGDRLGRDVATITNLLKKPPSATMARYLEKMAA